MYEDEKTETLLKIESNRNKKRTLIIIGSICVLLMITVAGGLGWYFYRVNVISGNLEQGNVFASEKKYQEAIQAFESVLSMDGKNPDAIIGIANAYSGLGDFEKAKTNFEKAMTLTTDAEDLKHLYDAYIESAVKNKVSEENLFELLDQAFEKTGSETYNKKKSEYEAKVPTFNLTPGTYQGKQTLQINKGNDSDKIYFTVDGSDPSSSSKEYSTPIELNTGTMKVKAVEVGQDGFAGKIVNGEYIIQEVANEAVQLQGSTVSSTGSAIRNFSARASSTLPNINGLNYSANNILDQNDNTAWVEGVPGDGIGEYVELVYTGSQSVMMNGFAIKNGYIKSTKAFDENGSPSEIEVLVNNSSKYRCKLERIQDEQKFSITPLKLSNGDTIRFVIRNAVVGSDDGVHDTAITEITVF